MAFQFKTWLKGLFPEYFWRNDTYLDANNKGFFERYIDSFGDEYANEVYPFIRDVLDILDARITPTKYLPYLSKMMGNLPNTGNASIQRKLIAYAVRLWMIKGTIPSYEFIFNLFGLGVHVIEHWGARPIKYDNSPLNYYDDAESFYDIDCPCITEYSLAYWNQLDNCSTGTTVAVSQDVLDAIQKLICLIQPIDTKLKGMIRSYNICEDFDITITDGNTSGPNSCAIPNNVQISNTLGCNVAGNTFTASNTANPGETLLQWSVAIGAVGYELEYRVSGTTQWATLFITNNPSVDNYLENNLTPGLNYDFRFREKLPTGYCLWHYINNWNVYAAACSVVTNIQITNTP